MKRIPTVLFLLGWVCQAYCARIDSETLLKKKLMQDYDPTVLPTNTIDVPVSVNFNTRLRRIVNINEVKQSITVYMWGRQSWNDPRLAWNASEYDGISVVNLNSAQLWMPDTTLYSRLPPGNFIEIPVSCSVNSKGDITWLSPIQLESTCLMELNEYPRDTQTCAFVFGSWGNDGGKIDYTIPVIKDSMSDYVPNEQWTLDTLLIEKNSVTYSCCPNPYVDITFTLVVSRSMDYPIMNFVVPSVLLSILSILTFLLPPESGERITLSITILLSTTLFQQLTASLIPPSQVPVISIFYFTSLLMNCLSLVATTIILRSYFHTRYPRMNRCLYKIIVVALGCLMRCRCSCRPKPRRSSKVLAANTDGHARTASPPYAITNHMEIAEANGVISGSSQQQLTPSHIKISPQDADEEEHNKEEWLELVLILDRFCVIFFTVLITVTCVVIWTLPADENKKATII